MDRPHRIALMFNPLHWRKRGALRAISRFANERGDCELILMQYHRYPTPVGRLRTVADGVICDGVDDTIREVRRAKLPTVSLDEHPRLAGTPTVTHDFADAGRMVAHELIARGVKRLRAFSTTETFRLDAIAAVAGFRDVASPIDRGYACFEVGPRTLRRGTWVLNDQLHDLAAWLSAQPAPFGLLAVDDEHAWRAGQAARMAGLTVPGDVSIIGLGDDRYLCDSTSPSLSSVALDTEQAGFQAASMLQRLLEGEDVPAIVRLRPLGVIHRASSDYRAADDPDVSEALQFIWESIAEGIDVPTVAEHVAMSTRTLHRRFLSAIGRTPGEEIRRARLETARRLITTTDKKLVEIALDAGFPSASQLSRDIERAFGMRPTELRRRATLG